MSKSSRSWWRQWVVLSVGFLVAGAMAAAGSPAWAAKGVAEDLPDELLVGFHEGASDTDVDAAIHGAGGTKVEKLHGLKVHRISVPAPAKDAVAKALAKHKDVEFVEPNRRHPSEFTPNDPQYGSQWHLPKIAAPQAWDITQGQPDVIIAILDSGIDGSHPDLKAKLVPGYNFYNNNTNTADVYGHGTKCAGAAAAAGHNAVGIAGVALQNKIMPIRVSDSSGWATSSALANGLVYAVDHGAKVMNMSFANVATSLTISTAAKYVISKGGVVVAAAGNCGCLDPTAENIYMISVSATDTGDNLASFSSYGNYVDVAAPGVNIYTTTVGGGYSNHSGTSFAAPVVAGLIGLMMSVNPSLTPSDLETLLKANTDEKGAAGWDQKFGFGRVNAYRAVAAAAASVPLGPGGDSTPPPSLPTFTAKAGPTGGAVDLAWTNPTTDFAGTLVLRRAGSPVGDVPTPGKSYSVGETVGGSTVIFAGLSPTASTDAGLTDGTTYHYKAFAYDFVRNYDSGIGTSATPVASTSCASEIIIDNLPAGKSSTQIAFSGTWAASGVKGFYGADSLYSAGSGTDTYTWQTGVLNTLGSCTYDVYAWWAAYSSRSTTVPYTVSGHSDGSTTKTFNQQTGGGIWQKHGTYTFAAGAKATVKVSDANGPASADAVRLVLSTTAPSTAPPLTAPAPEIVVDNGAAGTSGVGSWCASGVKGFFGTGSLYSCGTVTQTYRWTPPLPAAGGTFDVYVWWTAYTNRSATAPYTVGGHSAGSTTKVFNQQTGGGAWQYHGTYTFAAGAIGFVEVSSINGLVSADAVRLVPVVASTEAPVAAPQSP